MKKKSAPANQLEIINGHSLPLIDHFYTIQGEGYHTGKPAYLLRLGGCDSCCSWCDTKVSWNPDFHDLVNIEDILSNVLRSGSDSIVVTGGEPSKYKLQPLCDLLRRNNIKTFIETAGTNLLTGEWDWICFSPKKHDPPISKFYSDANELKLVISDSEDFLWAEETAAKVNKECRLFLQPEWFSHKKNIDLIVNYVKLNPKWRISIQMHKFIGIP